jgi:hypothetical protein
MGSVTGSGRSVTYARTDKSGANTVTVKDANQWTATAQVLQSPQELAIFPESATVSVTNKETRVFSAIGGTGSYRWEITSGDGSLSNRTGQQTTYKAGASMADTVIELFDGGSTVSATVTKTE